MNAFLRCTTIMLALLASTLHAYAQGIARPSPFRTVNLHTNAEWRVNAQVEFDSVGRLLILYRDKFKLSANGNWHLIRLTNPSSGTPVREEITFSIPQEPVNPRATDRWINFRSHLLLNADGSQADAIFSGTVVTTKLGPPPATGGNNVSVDSFSSAASFDLTTFRLLACAGFAQLSTASGSHQIDADGNLLVLDQAVDWKILVLDKSLRQIRTVAVSTPPTAKNQPIFCQVRPDYSVDCSGVGGDPAFIVSAQSTIQLPQSPCKMKPGTDPLGFGKDQKLVNGFIESDRLCVLDRTGREERLSSNLTPLCHQGWKPDVISPDHRSLLISCAEFDGLLDTFFSTKVTLQLVDVPTFAQRGTIPLSSRRRSAYIIFHHSGATTIAVLEDGEKLVFYSIDDTA